MTDPAADLGHFVTLGRQAYLRDQPAAPATNAEVMAAIGDAKVGDGVGMVIMRAFSQGYEIERDLELAHILAED